MKRTLLCIFMMPAFCILLSYAEASTSANLVLGQTGFTSNQPNYPPAGEWQCSSMGLNLPQGIFSDYSGNIWVTDDSNARVLKFNNPYSNAWAASLVLGQPDFITNTHVPIAYYGQYYDPLGYSIGPPTQALMFSAADVVVDTTTKRVYACDRYNRRVLWWNNSDSLTNGHPADGVLGRANFTSTCYSNVHTVTQTEMDRPIGVAVDASGNVWVVDGSNNRVLKFINPTTNGQAASLVLGQPDFTSNAPAVTQTGMKSPRNVAVDSLGNVWVTDTGRVLKYTNPTTNGQAASLVLGQPDFTTGTLHLASRTTMDPNGIHVDSLGNVWVADWCRVLKFDNPSKNGQAADGLIGAPDFNSTQTGCTQTLMYNTYDISVDGLWNLWVSDNFNRRVLRFTPRYTKISDLGVVLWTEDNPQSPPVTANSVMLQWTAPGCVGEQTDLYKIWYATYPITNALLSSLTTYIEDTFTHPVGTVEQFTVTGLGRGTKYYFAVKAEDIACNFSELSNAATATTLLDVPFYSQGGDPWESHWGNNIYLNATNLMKDVGCNLTCMAMIINYYKYYHPIQASRDGIVLRTPGELNEYLKANPTLYDTLNHDIRYSKLPQITNHAMKMEFDKIDDVDNKILNKELENKRPAILVINRLGSDGKTKSHFVVAIGSCPIAGNIINDPGHVSPYRKTLINYNNKYNRIRTIRPTTSNDKFSNLEIRMNK